MRRRLDTKIVIALAAEVRLTVAEGCLTVEALYLASTRAAEPARAAELRLLAVELERQIRAAAE
jgi:hypothetical protein